MSQPIETNQVVQLVESYVYTELSDAKKFENSDPLDEDGIYRLHDLAAKVYALGFYDGTCIANERHNRRRSREHEAEREATS